MERIQAHALLWRPGSVSAIVQAASACKPAAATLLRSRIKKPGTTESAEDLFTEVVSARRKWYRGYFQPIRPQLFLHTWGHVLDH